MGMKIGTLREIGAKKGDVVTFNDEIDYKFTVDRVSGGTVYGRSVQGDKSYDDNWSFDGADNWRIVQPDAPTGPVRTVTKREIVFGQYGAITVDWDGLYDASVVVSRVYGAAELRAAIATLTEIADAMEEQ